MWKKIPQGVVDELGEPLDARTWNYFPDGNSTMSDETPAAKVIRLLGVKRLAWACDLTTSAVQKWSAGPGRIPA
ncbi:MAG TPA: hypothetical protein VMU59_06675, partial [Caulobacteraceae bacterium]|nr:hypothetical protein [Caulobacteraceae bacterium]